MRIDVVKYLVVGPTQVKERFFRHMQSLGIMEFIATTPSSLERPAEIQSLLSALHILRQRVPVSQAPGEDYRSAAVVAAQVVERNQEVERLRERARILEKESARIAIFGHFSLAQLRDIEKETGRVIQFFCATDTIWSELAPLPELIHIGRAANLHYFISVNQEKKNYRGAIEILMEYSLNELLEQIAYVQREIDRCEDELASLTHYKNALVQGLINELNQYHLRQAESYAEGLLEEKLFAVTGWIPVNKVEALVAAGKQFHVHVEPIQKEKGDKVSTYLENRGAARLGEDLVSIYDTPSQRDRDPSGWVFWAFLLFFSMIVGDAGYGLILFGLSLFLYFTHGKKSPLVRRFVSLLMSLSIGCMVWGTLLTSFLGITVSIDSPLRKISPVHWMVYQKASYLLERKPTSYTELIHDYPQLASATTPRALLTGVSQQVEGMGKELIYSNFTTNVLLELSVFIGVIHIILSLLRYLDRKWAGAGWILFLVGAYLYFPLLLGAYSFIHYAFHVPYEAGGVLGQYLLYGGLALAALLALVQKKLHGLGETMHIIEIFADVVSYLRIYALSLAGMIMATTFNQIGSSLPIYVGVFVILAGHMINLTLAIMGGVIHGLRLNFIEWYHYSFEGGGKKFSPLAVMETK